VKGGWSAQPASIQRHQTLELDYVLWKMAKKPALRDEHVPETSKIERLERADSAVQDTQGVPAGGTSEIIAFQQQYTEPETGSLMSNGDPIDATPDHDQVVSGGSRGIGITRNHTDHRTLQS
jgi:hypothetical protein